jgi:AcrR family transcriptional regulator
MDEIAESAELSKGTLYLYYKSKEDLYIAVLLRGSEIMYEMFKKAIATDENPIRHLFNLGEAYFAYFQEQRNYFRMYYFLENPRIHSQVSSEMMEQCELLDTRIWDLVVGIIRRAVEGGLLRDDVDPLEAGVMLWSNSNGLMRLIDRDEWAWTGKHGLNLEAMLRKANKLLVQAMMTEKAKASFDDLVTPARP